MAEVGRSEKRPDELRTQPRPGSHQAFLASALLACAPAAALGIGRFGYALVVPAMHADLHWSYFEAGMLGTANALGYLIGAIVGAGCGRALGERVALAASLAVVVVSVFLCAASGSIIALSALRIAAGVAAGVIYIVGGGIATRLGHESGEASKTIAIYFAGVGAGILLSGLTVPEAIQGSASEWRRGWIILGLGAALGFAGLLVGLSRMRSLDGMTPVAATAGSKEMLRKLRPAFIAYGLEGAGYIAYMTFAVALIRMEEVSTNETIAFWSAVGLGAALSTPLLSRHFAHPRLRGGRGIACGIAALAIATLLPLLSAALPVLLVSALIFGSSFIAVATATALFLRKNVPAEQVTALLGSFTIIFAVGQILGPILAGSIADTHSGLRLGLLASVVVLVAAVPIALLQRDV